MTIEFKNITHSYGNHQVLNELNFEARAGEITCLLGGSGCGKSTLLRIAAGIEQLQHGAIYLDNKEFVTPNKQPAPERRPVGIMFQENALFPHMNIAQNIAFGLNKMSPSDKDPLVSQWLERIGLSGYDKRYPHTLSGGQIQRVALARSLAPQPSVLLMDEPYASIDNVLRRQLRESARALLKRAQATTIFVTHDPIEALEMADVIAVMESGKIVQSASPEVIFEKPESAVVASLFGDAINIQARPCEGGFQTEYGFIQSTQFSATKACTLVIRPEGLHMKTDKQSKLTVTDIRFAGNKWILHLLPEQTDRKLEPLRVSSQEIDNIGIGRQVSIEAKSEGFFVFDN